MSDRAFDPPSENVFDQFDPEKVGPMKDPANTELADNPFAKFNPFEGEDPRPAAPQTSATASFAHSMMRSVVPSVASLPAIGAGAELGAAAGAFAGPLGAGVGALVGGIGGAIGGGAAVSAAQDWALSKLPDSWQEALGQDQRTRRLEESQHSMAAFMGGLVPFALTMRPGAIPRVALPENATALDRIMANPATARLFGGGVMGGLELGTELVHGEAPDWTKVGISTGFGIVFNRPTRVGERLIESGARPARAALGRAEPVREGPTIAQAADTKVMGPGVTEDVFQGAHEQSVPSALSAQDQARTEQSMIGEPAQHDLHALARQIDPDTLTRYDELSEQARAFRGWIAEVGEEGSPAARKHLSAIEAEMDELGPHVAAAYRRAEEATTREPEHALAPPEPAPEALPGRPIEEQRTAITEDVRRQLVGAGRPAEEADAAARLIAARYEARARWFKGALGSPEELYAREGAEIRGPGRTQALTAGPAEPPPVAPARQEAPVEAAPRPEEQPAPAAEPVLAPVVAAAKRGPAAAPKEGWSLIQFLAAHGGISASDPLIGDVRGSLGTGNKFVPGFGNLIRKGGMPLDKARELAVHSGYLADSGEHTAGLRESTINHLLDAVDREMRGEKVYRIGHEPAERRQDPAKRDHELTQHADAYLDSVDEPRENLDPKIYARMLEMMDRENLDPGIAHERAVMEADEHAIEAGQAQDREVYLPGWDVPHDAGAAPGAGASVEAGQPGAGEGARAGGERAGEARGEEVEYFQRRKREREDALSPEYLAAIKAHDDASAAFRKASADHLAGKIDDEKYFEVRREFEAETKRFDAAFDAEQKRARQRAPARGLPGQMELLGTEPIGQGEQAQRAADQALKPTVEQKPMDIGLFGDTAAQKELFQRDQAPPFYSAVGRAIDNVKMEKASPDQWLATIRNTPGVKAEELEWLGVADWLKDQDGPVTRAQLQDYVRANAIEVKEVAKGTKDAEAKARLNEINDRLEEIQDAFDMLHGEPDSATLAQRRADLAREQRQLRNELAELWKGESAGGAPKFSSYTLPGGENYRELLLTLPQKSPTAAHLVDVQDAIEYLAMMREQTPAQIRQEFGYIDPRDYVQLANEAIDIEAQHGSPDYHGSHWDEPNVLAHVRFNDRTIDGKRTLFIEEAQSDWHQAGKRKGYQQENPPLTPEQRKELDRERNRLSNEIDELDQQWKGMGPGDERKAIDAQIQEKQRRMDEIGASFGRYRNEEGVPDAPFKTTWPELSIKRMIRYAAENGYEKVAWTKGETQAERYDLSQHLREIEYVKNADGTYRLGIADKDGEPIRNMPPGMDVNKMTLPHIEETVGKEIAEKIKNEEGKRYRGHDGKTLDGLDLKVGGEGMKGFYDKILPATVNKLVKKFGAKVEAAQLPGTGRMEAKYVGPEPTAEQIAAVEQMANARPTQREFVSPITGQRQDFQINRVANSSAVRLIRERMHSEGLSFADAMAIDGHQELADIFGGRIEEARNPAERTQVHTLDITPALHEAATEQGFPLFQGARGKIRLAEGQRPIITLMKDANASTFIHETGHDFLEQMMRDAQHPQAPAQLRDDATTITDWLGVNGAEDIKRRHHEKFARGFEQYLREGVAPSQGLADVFAKFKDWLTRIYQTLKGLGAPINDDIRRVFDRMLAAEPQRAVIAPEREAGRALSDIHVQDAAEVAPHEAEARLDLVSTEKASYLNDLPAEVRSELDAAAQRVKAAETPEGASEPSGTAGEGAVRPEDVGQGGGGPGPVTTGDGGGAQPRALEPGRSGPRGESPSAPERAGGQSGASATGESVGHEPLAARPAALLGPRESPFTDKAGNIRLDNLTTSGDVAQAIRDSAKENNDFIGDRRGVVTDGQVMELADALGMDFQRLNQRRIGQAFNAEQIIAARKLLVESATEVSAAMKRAATGTDEDVMVYARVKDRHQMIQAQVAGITAEAGRALRAFRDISGSAEAQNVDQFLRTATGKTLFQLREEAKLGAALDSTQQISKFMMDAQKRSFGGMILEYFVNDLISGPATHATYVVGNAILLAEKLLVVTPVAAAMAKARGAMGREAVPHPTEEASLLSPPSGNVVQLGEVRAGLKGFREGIAPAISAVGTSLRSGVTALLPGEKPGSFGALPLQPGSELAQMGHVDLSTRYRDILPSAYSWLRGVRDGLVANAGILAAGGIEGSPLLGWKYSHLGQIPDLQMRGVTVAPIGSVIRAPGRGVAAIHTLFRVLNYTVDAAQEAYRTAAAEGLSGAALNARVAELRANPTEAMMQRARTTATDLTLMGQSGEFMRRIQSLTNWTTDIPGLGTTQPLKFIDPFVHIAGQIVKRSFGEQTPLGLLSSEVRADLMGRNGSVAQDMASAKMLVGSTIALTFGGLAAEGMMSGAGPEDRNENAVWRLAGNQPHSVRIGDTWYSIHKLGPLGLLASAAADMYEVGHAAKEEDLSKVAWMFLHAVRHNFMEEGFMRGPADLIKAIEEPARYGESYVRNFLSSFVPYSVGMAQMARAVDPYSRQVRSTMDAVMVKLPYLSMSLLPRRDIWGQPLMNPDALGGKGVTAIYERQMSADPVNRAMLDLGMGVAPVAKKIRNVELTPEQYDDFARIAGVTAKTRLDTIVRSDAWTSWPNHVKHDVIVETVRQSREAARGMMMAKYPQIVKDAVELKMERFKD